MGLWGVCPSIRPLGRVNFVATSMRLQRCKAGASARLGLLDGTRSRGRGGETMHVSKARL